MDSHGGDGTLYLIPGDTGCDHERTTFIGGDRGNNEYYRCDECTGVLVRTGEVDYRHVREQIAGERRSQGRLTAVGRTDKSGVRDSVVERIYSLGKRVLLRN